MTYTLESTRPARTTGAATGWSTGARIGAVGIGGFLLASVATGLLTPGYSPAREAISALAATDSRYAWLMITGFLAAAVGLTSTGVTLWHRLSPAATGRVAGRIGAAVLVACGPLMASAGLARQDCSDRLPGCRDFGEAPLASTHYWVHQYVSLSMFLLISVAILFVARGLRDSAWRHLAIPARIAGGLCLLTIVQLVVDPPVLAPYQGIVQRIFLVLLFGTPLLVAAAGRRDSAQA